MLNAEINQALADMAVLTYRFKGVAGASAQSFFQAFFRNKETAQAFEDIAKEHNLVENTIVSESLDHDWCAVVVFNVDKFLDFK